MLHRAASNAYSWWWASHIRTRQSKWLDQNLQEMEEKVRTILKFLEEDADSFAKRAEMYYRKRPELISFVEESYRAYRALAERYDHISGELQNANNTIANVFPDQVQFGMDEEDEEEGTPKKISPLAPPAKPPKNVPQIPNFGLKIPKESKKPNVSPSGLQPRKIHCSSVNNEKAREEVDKLQKGILVLQTEKEFVKSSYESTMKKYWNIETQIKEMQENVFNLQDEFNVESIIDDDEARALMATTALKSCEETLAHLQEQQRKSSEEARIESERVTNAEKKLKALKGELVLDSTENENVFPNSYSRNLEAEFDCRAPEKLEVNSAHEKVKQYIEMNSDPSLSVSEMAEKIDELVNKVLTLENEVSSQTALIKRLRAETDELQKHLQTTEEEKITLIDDSSNLNQKLKVMEEELHGIQDLTLSVRDQNSQIQTHFNEACRNLDDLSEKFHTPIKSDGIEDTDSLQEEKSQQIDTADIQPQAASKQMQHQISLSDGISGLTNGSAVPGEQTQEAQKINLNIEENCDRVKEPQIEIVPEEMVQDAKSDEQSSTPLDSKVISPELEYEDPLWQQLFFNGLENREKILLTEYTAILRNYKDVKKKLSEVEKKNQETIFRAMAEVRELKSAIAMKDLEMRFLKQKLNILQNNPDENSESDVNEFRSSQHIRQRSKLDRSQSWVPVFTNDDSNQITTSKGQDSASAQNADEPKEVLPVEEDVKMILMDESTGPLSVEEIFRRDIDELLEVNLEFWLRFSSSFHQIQKFQTSLQELEREISKLKERKRHANFGSNSSSHHSEKPNISCIDKKLREVQKEMSAWLNQNLLLKLELQSKLASLSRMQQEISKALKMSLESEHGEFTPLQAAKFHGEVLNIEQENNTVAEELQAGMDHVTALESEVEKFLSKLKKKFGESSLKSGQNGQFHHLPSMRHSTSRNRVPLRSFLFGIKQKKSKPSIFSCVMHPALYKQSAGTKAGGRPTMSM